MPWRSDFTTRATNLVPKHTSTTVSPEPPTITASSYSLILTCSLPHCQLPPVPSNQFSQSHSYLLPSSLPVLPVSFFSLAPFSLPVLPVSFLPAPILTFTTCSHPHSQFSQFHSYYLLPSLLPGLIVSLIRPHS
ncbi:hypothetical protein Pmani_037969 [Petrolisthes manimaculis]|uniref:Uncharacterized protein n=1 Tax=Petrolisthes manimaculis TaxID=1843537 RepID=A0AAE1NH50_9EUCA|nr:hypothetical protein Pmani_037969 [Petrolisthes manimaculis]